MPGNAQQYQIVLDKVPTDRQPAAALFLSGCFSLPPAATKGIAASGPIILISGLSRDRAESILAELAATLPPGVGLRSEDEADPTKASRLQWPRPPRIYGRDLSEFDRAAPPREAPCPSCGCRLRFVPGEGGEMKLALADDEPNGKPAEPRAASESDKDPLFSGIKPLAVDASAYASLRSLQAGDTGFWTDIADGISATSPEPEPQPKSSSRTMSTPGELKKGNASGIGISGSAGVSRRTNRNPAGLSAFMKPGAYAVMLSRTRDAQVVKMISEIMGMTMDEAREKGQNLGLCVARDISLDEAQNLLAKFKNTGAKARIVKPL